MLQFVPKEEKALFNVERQNQVNIFGGKLIFYAKIHSLSPIFMKEMTKSYMLVLHVLLFITLSAPSHFVSH